VITVLNLSTNFFSYQEDLLRDIKKQIIPDPSRFLLRIRINRCVGLLGEGKADEKGPKVDWEGGGSVEGVEGEICKYLRGQFKGRTEADGPFYCSVALLSLF